MDLTFSETKLAYLRRLLCQVIHQEETAETIVPDSMPDVGRIIGCWGVPVLRGKEWRGGVMTASGGVTAKLLYAPADDGPLQVLECYIPFTLRWELPPTDREGMMRTDCRLRSIDARMLNARKLLVRANIAALGEAFLPEEASFFSLPDPPRGLELQTACYPLTLPADCCEKTFLLDEDLTLPSSNPEMDKTVYFSLAPEVTEGKVLGGKAVFKGNYRLHLVYLTPDGGLSQWDQEVPFSQFADMSREFDDEPELSVGILPTGAELETMDDGRTLRLKCSILAQCLVCATQKVDVVQDAYSLRCPVELQKRSVELESRLDRRTLPEAVRIPTELAGNAADLAALVDYPKAERREGEVRLETPVCCTVLYYDENGALQGKEIRGETESMLPADESSRCYAVSESTGRMQYNTAAGELQGMINVMVSCCAGQPIEAVQGLTMGEPTPCGAQRPSVVLRRAKPGESLWSLGKTYGSTQEAIRQANDLPSDAPPAGTLLLIPIL